jgi:hypothetical protein
MIRINDNLVARQCSHVKVTDLLQFLVGQPLFTGTRLVVTIKYQARVARSGDNSSIVSRCLSRISLRIVGTATVLSDLTLKSVFHPHAR